MIPFNFHHLYYFYVIACEGSVLKAADKLRLAQPTLSAQLKQFEDFLEKKLFERRGRELILTEDGHYVLSYAKMIFDIGQELKEGLNDASQKGRIKLRIGVPSSVPKAFVDRLLQFLLKMNPDIYLTIIEQDIEKLIQLLEDYFLDLVITDIPNRSSSDSDIRSHLVANIPIVFCAHPSIARKYRRFPQDMDNAPMILPTAHSQIYQLVQEYLLAQKVTPRIIAEIQDIELVRRLVLAGFGIAPMNKYTALNAPTKERLVILDKKSHHTISDKIYLLTRKRKRSHPLLDKIISGFRLPA